MDQDPLVEVQLKDGSRFIERLVAEGIEVCAAGWLKEADSGHWYLYIVTPLVGDDGATRQAYRRILPFTQQMPAPYAVDSFRIKVVAPLSPVGEAMVKLLKRYSIAAPMRYDDYRLGDVNVEVAYIYPLPVITASL
jgi:hypothetical protein